MSIILPGGVPLLTRVPITLRVEKGCAVVNEPAQYPGFYVDSFALQEALGSDVGASYGSKLPAYATDYGLEWDPAWNVFAAFFDEHGKHLNTLSWQLKRALENNAVDWRTRCPAMQGPTTLIGQLIRQYGMTTGGKKSDQYYQPPREHQELPLEKLLGKASKEELRSFRDGTDTLLDLAFENQQWPLAQWLWDKGVRWSPEATERGEALEALIIGTRRVMESMNGHFLASERKADPEGYLATWVDKWLERYEKAEAGVPDKACLTYRRDHAKSHGMPVERDIYDTPASYWASTAFRAMQHSTRWITPAQVQPAYLNAHERWIAFWARSEVDFNSLPIPTFEKDKVGLRTFWEQWPDSQPWVEHALTVHQQAALEKATQHANAISPRMRL